MRDCILSCQSTTYRKYSLTPYNRQQSSYTSHTLPLIMRSLWKADVASDIEDYISGAYVHSCLCTLPRCLWMLSPHRQLLWLELVSIKARPSQMPKATHTHTHAHTHTQPHRQRKQIPFAAFPGGFNDWDSCWLRPHSVSLVRVEFFSTPYDGCEWFKHNTLKGRRHWGLTLWVGWWNSPSSLIHSSFPPCSHSLVHKKLLKSAASWQRNTAFAKVVSGDFRFRACVSVSSAWCVLPIEVHSSA